MFTCNMSRYPYPQHTCWKPPNLDLYIFISSLWINFAIVPMVILSIGYQMWSHLDPWWSWIVSHGRIHLHGWLSFMRIDSSRCTYIIYTIQSIKIHNAWWFHPKILLLCCWGLSMLSTLIHMISSIFFLIFPTFNL